MFQTALDANAAQGLVPTLFGPQAKGIEVGVTDLALEVAQGLLGTDKGRRDLAADQPVGSGLEFEISARVLAVELRGVGLDEVRRPDAVGGEGTVEDNHEVVGEVRGHTAVIEAADADDFILGGDDLDR